MALTRVSRALVVGLALLVGAAVLSVYTSRSSSEARRVSPATGPGAAAGAGPEAGAKTLSTEVTRVSGRLAPADRRRVERAVGSVLSTYLARAFLSGRRSGIDALSGFTPGARRLALRQRRVLTGVDLRARSVRLQHGYAYLSVLAPQRRPVGATARLDVRLGVGRLRHLDLTGRLGLTPTDHGWKVFAFDLARTPEPRR